MILTIIISIILIILFTPIKIKISNQEKKNNIDLFIVKLFNLRIDIDESINKLKNSTKTFKDIKKQYNKYQLYKGLITNIFNQISITKLTIIINASSISSYVLLYNTIFYLRNIFNINFLNLDNEYYNVSLDESKKTSYNYEIIFYIRGIYFILAYIISVKGIILKK